MKKNVLVSLLLAVSFVLATSLPTMAQGFEQTQTTASVCRESAKKRIGMGAVGGAILGAFLGGIIRGKKGVVPGVEIGASAGAALSAKKPSYCNHPKTASYNPYNTSIAPANAPVATAEHVVVPRNFDGADSTALEPILAQDLAKLGYQLGDPNSFKGTPQFYLDVTVRQTGDIQSGQGGGFGRSQWSQYGSGWSGGGVYQVSVSLVNTDGIVDPHRTATKTVTALQYAAQDGNYTVADISGYGQQSVWANDPQTGAATAAINIFFSPHPQTVASR